MAFLDSLVNRPNTILARQLALQADPRPVFRKTPRAGLYFGLYLTLFGAGLVGSLHGVSLMIRGKKSGF